MEAVKVVVLDVHEESAWYDDEFSLVGATGMFIEDEEEGAIDIPGYISGWLYLSEPLPVWWTGERNEVYSCAIKVQEIKEAL